MKGLNERQSKFCEHYALTLNGTQSAKLAGYAESSAPHMAFKLLEKPEVRDRIDELQRDMGEKILVSGARTLKEIAYLAYSDVTTVLDVRSRDDLKRLPQHVRHAIKKIKINTNVKKDDNGFEVEHDRAIEIEMHAKNEPMKILAEIAGLQKSGKEAEKLEDAAPFVGMQVILAGEDQGARLLTSSPDSESMPHGENEGEEQTEPDLV